MNRIQEKQRCKSLIPIKSSIMNPEDDHSGKFKFMIVY